MMLLELWQALKEDLPSKFNQECKGLYTHCYGHSLNLAVSNTVKSCKNLQDGLDTTFKIGKL